MKSMYWNNSDPKELFSNVKWWVSKQNNRTHTLSLIPLYYHLDSVFRHRYPAQLTIFFNLKHLVLGIIIACWEEMCQIDCLLVGRCRAWDWRLRRDGHSLLADKCWGWDRRLWRDGWASLTMVALCMAQHQTPTYDNWTAFITLDWDWHWEHSAPAQCPACTQRPTKLLWRNVG